MPSFGNLFASLTLESASFMSGIKAAQKEIAQTQKTFQKVGGQMQKVGGIMSAAITAPLAGIGAAFIGSARQIAEGIPELEKLAGLAGTTTQEFQRMAFAAESVGFAGDKLGDIYKDVNDKFGEFLSTGGGEMKDFFENVAPKIGLTAEAFRNLSGPDALQLYYNSLEKAGLNQAQMTFYMEALANDATALIPLLRDNGKAFDDLGAKAAVVGPEDAASMKAYVASQKEMEQAFRKLTIAVVGSGLLEAFTGFITSITNLASGLSETNPQLLQIGVGVAAVAAAIGPFVVTIGTLVQGFAALIPLFATAAPATAAAGAAAGAGAVGFGALSAALLPIAAIAGAVAAVGYLIYQNWDRIAPVLQAAGAAAMEAIGPAVRQAVDTLGSALSELWNGPFGQALRTVIGVLQEFHGVLLRALGVVALNAIKVLAAVVVAAAQTIGDAIRMVSRFLSGDWAGAWQAAYSIVNRLLGGLPDWVIGQVGRMVDGIKPHLDRMATILRASLNPIEAVRLGFFKLYDAVVGHSYVPDMVDGVGVHMRRLDAEMVQPASAATSKVGEAFRALANAVQPILDRLFPEQARTNQFLQELADLGAGMKAMGATADQTAEAVRRLKDEYYKQTGGTEMMTGADVVRNAPGGLEIETGDVLGDLGEISEATKKEWDKVTGANDNLKASFADLARDVTGSLQGLVNNIKSGDWLSAMSSVLDLVGQIGGIIKGSATPAIRTYPLDGARAAGGPVLPRGSYLVGERGPEILRMGGRRGMIVPNDQIGGAGVVQLQVTSNDYFDAKVAGISGSVSVETSATMQRGVARRQSRSLAS